MNVHPSRTVDEFLSVLDRYVIPVRERMAPGEPFGLVPHLGRSLTRDLESRAQRERVREVLTAHDLRLFSINAFPLEDFHQPRVKEQVYSPPWTKSERSKLTNAIADVMADLMVEGTVGTISTLGGSYRAWGDTAKDHAKIAAEYAKTVVHLAELERESGVTIFLTVEPEPDTTFEVADDVIALFRDHLLAHVAKLIGKPLGIGRARAEETLHRFFQVNLDVCHQSVLFRDPVEEWKQLDRAGLRVGKLHVTNAIALRSPSRSPRAVAELREYVEPKYLHQFAGRRPDGSLVRGGDLDQLTGDHLAECDEIRVHFHVPVSRDKLERLSTTRAETAAAIAHARRLSDPPHIVVETYTWPLLAATSNPSELVRGITRELRWTTEQLQSTAG
ncbi:MAG: metabolite traffic protein EboE [Planctomycetota bacterium]